MIPVLYVVELSCVALLADGDFCFISLMGRATYILAENRYELHLLKYSKPKLKRTETI